MAPIIETVLHPLPFLPDNATSTVPLNLPAHCPSQLLPAPPLSPRHPHPQRCTGMAPRPLFMGRSATIGDPKTCVLPKIREGNAIAEGPSRPTVRPMMPAGSREVGVEASFSP